ncbi:histidine kinase [Candidatus Acetothermia bacterium]|nr:histidine kinase [Candidatus Acetothermia bacterium]MBI3642757.1 histidine kinase [Candidatus Acetothermia bacterium]
MKSAAWEINWRGWQSWLWLFAVFTAFNLFETFRLVLSLVASGYNSADISRVLSPPVLGRELIETYCVAILVPAFWALAKRFHFRQVRWWVWIPANIGLLSIFVFIHQILFRISLWSFDQLVGSPLRINLFDSLTIWNLLAIVSIGAQFVLLLGAFYGIDAYLHSREHELVAATLSEQLAEARLKALQSQLHPHFLFNTLQSIAILFHLNPDAAEKMLIKLGDLLRVILDHDDHPVIELHQEVEFLKKYLEIQKIRFGDRFEVRWQLSEASLDLPVPNFILQPLVENSLRHGLGNTPANGVIEIGSDKRSGFLRLWVSDNGSGLSSSATSTGKGLCNIQDRLWTLYGNKATLRLEPLDTGGTIATIELPIAPIARSNFHSSHEEVIKI